ncbi:MAG TPA: winged helix DNA-binding domain-containing protein [Candidatus Limnocylindria bacterium]|nr:winged helix DNA-binding domain-containing protein [Candidatus Limnocylindria bacterium]
MPKPVLDRRTLNRTLLARQGLLRREPRAVAGTIEHVVGMQSQVPRDPFVALWSRIEGFDPAELDRLMNERKAVRTGLMRTTLHLVTASDALAMQPLFAPVLARVLQSQRAFRTGLAGLDLGELATVGAELLSSHPMTAGQLRPLLAERWPDRDPSVLMMGIRYLVPIVQVPPRGLWRGTSQPTLTSLRAWLGRPADSQPVIGALLLRYLAAFGPASVPDMRTWSWLTGLAEVVDGLRGQLRSYRSEGGRELLDLADGQIVDAEVPAPPRFLPEYDNLFLSHDDRSRIEGSWYPQDRYSRGKLFVDGFLTGGWRVDVKQRTTARLTVDLFRRLRAEEGSAVDVEAEALLRFLAPDADVRSVDVAVLE